VEIRRVGAKLFHSDRRTNRHDEPNSSFPQLFEGA